MIPRDRSSNSRKGSRFSFAANKWYIYAGLGIITLILIINFGPTIAHPIEQLISSLENRYQQWFLAQEATNPFILLLLAFIGGVIASVSPCILAMLPVNLSYIGTLEIKSRWQAFTRAGLFALGAVTILSLFGLVSSFAGAVMVEYRGHINLVVGLIMTVMGLWLIGIINIPLPQTEIDLPVAGPYGVGLTFALVSSPCASPVLFGVLAAAAATGSQILATLTMISYALGYTILIFLASLFAGLAKQSKKLLRHSQGIIRFASLALILTGIYYLYTAIQWFFAA